MSKSVIATLTLAALVVSHNALAAIAETDKNPIADIKKFKDRKTGIKRVEHLFDLATANRAAEAGDLPALLVNKDGTLGTAEVEKKDAAEKPAKTKSAAKTKAKTAKPGRAPAFSDSDVIVIRAEGNPKHGTAAQRFSLYSTGMTVGQYVEANNGDRRQALRDIAWDSGKERGWIVVAGPKSAVVKAALAPKAQSEAPKADSEAPVADVPQTEPAVAPSAPAEASAQV